MEASKEFESLSIDLDLSERVVGVVADSKKPAAGVAVIADGLEKSETANNTERDRKHPPKARLTG